MRPISFSRVFSLIMLVSLLMGLLSSCSTSAPQAPVAEPPVADNNQPASENTQAPEPTTQATNTPAPSPVPPTPTPQILPLSLSEPLVWQGDYQEVLYVFYVENPNQDFGIDFVNYSITLLDASGKELKVVSDYFLPGILPGQKIGIAGRSYVDAGTVTQAQITLLESVAMARSELQPVIDKPLTVDNLKFNTHNVGDNFVGVTGIVTNPLDVDLGGTSVFIIAYDSEGKIIGGGEANIGFLLPNDSSAFTATIMAAGEIDRVETYPVVTRFKDMLTSNTVPEDASAPILVNTGYAKDKFGSVNAAILLTNPNSKYKVFEKYMMTAYALDGSVLYVAWGYATLFPDATMGLSQHLFLSSDDEVDRVDFKVLAFGYEKAEVVPTFSYTVSKIESNGSGQVVTGEINNPTDQELTNFIVHAIAYDELGQIIGATAIRLESLPANGKADLEFEFALDSTPAKVELYPDLDF